MHDHPSLIGGVDVNFLCGLSRETFEVLIVSIVIRVVAGFCGDCVGGGGVECGHRVIK